MTISTDVYEVEKLKWKIISEYKDSSLSDAVDGVVKENDEGTFYRIGSKEEFDMKVPRRDDARCSIQSNLQLVSGIGEKTEMKLKDEGICDLFSLHECGRYGDKVEKIVKAVDSENISEIQSCIERWFTMSHPLSYHLMGMVEPEDILFFDIETMGLRYRPVFLIGVGVYEKGEFKVRQYLARNLNEEKAIIHEFLSDMDEHGCLASFNGRSFDSRFLKERIEMHEMKGSFDKPHFDLLHISRGAWKDDVPNHKLTTLEKHLFGEERKHDVISSMVPNFYKLFLKKGNPGPLVPVIEHNRKDIVTLGRLVDLLAEKYG